MVDLKEAFRLLGLNPPEGTIRNGTYYNEILYDGALRAANDNLRNAHTDRGNRDPQANEQTRLWINVRRVVRECFIKTIDLTSDSEEEQEQEEEDRNPGADEEGVGGTGLQANQLAAFPSQNGERAEEDQNASSPPAAEGTSAPFCTEGKSDSCSASGDAEDGGNKGNSDDARRVGGRTKRDDIRIGTEVRRDFWFEGEVIKVCDSIDGKQSYKECIPLFFLLLHCFVYLFFNRLRRHLV
jgi:hypothetical protein